MSFFVALEDKLISFRKGDNPQNSHTPSRLGFIKPKSLRLETLYELSKLPLLWNLLLRSPFASWQQESRARQL